MSITEFDQIEELFRTHGVERIYVKTLATKQDNDKNQIYLASKGSANSILNIFPAELNFRSPSASTKKRKSESGKPKIEMLLNFKWLSEDGKSHPAPHSKIINYFQYPEARFSGFLKECKNPPDALRRTKQQQYGKRVLVLGSNDAGETFGLVVTEKDDLVVGMMPALSPSSIFPALLEHVIGATIGISPRALLIDELKIVSGEWHPSISLIKRDDPPIPFKGNQGAGFTLEALLNVPRNSSKAPDKHGFELKSYKQGGKISLMTPTADLGSEGESSFRDFMSIFGWPGTKHTDRTVFNGLFKYHKPKETHRGHTHMLDLLGFHPSLNDLAPDGVAALVGLIEQGSGQLVSGWSFNKLLDGWKSKHSSACYVEYEKRPYSGTKPGHDAEYRFTGRLMVCEGTSIWDYLKAIVAQTVYYDPAHEILPTGKTKQRPQWRISVTKKFQEKLDTLYDQVAEEIL